MKKSELLARIEMLERRIAALEARPVVYPPMTSPWAWSDPFPGSPITTGTPPWCPPHVVTCTDGLGNVATATGIAYS